MDISHFRPNSLPTSFSKILEKVIYTRLYQRINQNNVLAAKQYGFRSNSSAEKASFKLTNAILLAALNVKLKVGALFCDLGKAFNSVKWGKIKHSVPLGSILGPLFFSIYINDLPNIVAGPSKPILFADDKSMIITNPRTSDFKEYLNCIIDNINDWFRGNSLSLSFDKMNILQFKPKNNYEINIEISCDSKLINPFDAGIKSS